MDAGLITTFHPFLNIDRHRLLREDMFARLDAGEQMHGTKTRRRGQETTSTSEAITFW